MTRDAAPFEDAVVTAAEAVRKGASLLDQGEIDTAIAAFTEAIRMDPANADAYAKRGRAFTRKDDPESALADCTEAIRLNPELGAAYAVRGWVHGRTGDIDEALADYLEAIRLDPQLDRAHCNLGGLYLHKGDFGYAVFHSSEAVRLDPNQAIAYVVRGNARRGLGECENAIADYTKAIRLDPMFVDAYTNRAALYANKGEFDLAAEDYGKVISLRPDFAPAYYERAMVASRKGEHGKAIEDYSEAIRIDSDFAEAYCDRGTAYNCLGEHGKSQADYGKAIRLKPDVAEYYVNRGIADSHLEEHEKAVADYTKAISLKPESAKVFYHRGVAYEHLRDYAQAVADYSEALRLDPANFDALLNRGEIYEFYDEDELALRDFTEAVRAKPDDARPYCERGELWAKLEQYEKALVDLTEAIRLDPANKSAYEARGGALDGMGEFARADADFQKAEELEAKTGETMFDQKTSVLSMLEHHFQPVPLGNLTITERRFPERVRADLQRAIDAIIEPMTVHRFCGVRKQHSYHGINFTELVVRDRHDPAVSVPLQYEEVDIGEEQPIRCLKTGLWLVEDAATRFALFLEPAAERGCGPGTIRLQLATINDEAGTRLSQQFYRQLERFVQEARSYRGKILSLEMHDHYSGMSSGIRVHKLRQVEREQVILPPQTLELLERNVINFVRERPRLSQIGMATKKGLLFYGPPGTGKTHTLHYLAGALEGMTTLLISAEQVGLLDEYVGLARLLQPSMVVIEDADLIARNREEMRNPAAEVLLNKLLNEMDGLREDADILFILTTNRPEAIEAALSSRPGRIDQAIEFPFPDEEGRSKLIRLYSRSDCVPEDVVRATVKKTDNVSAAFIKELMRRAAQFQLERDGSSAMRIADVDNALEEMLFKGGSLNRKLLGGKVDESLETAQL